ncbi:MAG: hypothetical protein Q9194_003293 [Teloschistes cf. exilis]
MPTVAYIKLLEDEAGIEGRMPKLHTGETGVPQNNFQEFGLVKQELETCLEKYPATMMTLMALEAGDYWQSLHMCDRFRFSYVTQPPRASSHIMLQRGILFWRYNLMRSLILPILGIQKAMFEAESQLWGCRGS